MPAGGREGERACATHHSSLRPVPKDSADVSLVRERDPQSALQGAEHDPVLLARQPNRRDVYDGRQLLDVVHEHAVEQLLVPLLKGGEVRVPLQVGLHAPDVDHRPLDL